VLGGRCVEPDLERRERSDRSGPPNEVGAPSSPDEVVLALEVVEVVVDRAERVRQRRRTGRVVVGEPPFGQVRRAPRHGVDDAAGQRGHVDSSSEFEVQRPVRRRSIQRPTGSSPPGEVPCPVGVQALDARPGAADAAARARAGVVGGDLGVALGGVARVRRSELVGVDGGLGGVDATVATRAGRCA
jgi:hypothetical protein